MNNLLYKCAAFYKHCTAFCKISKHKSFDFDFFKTITDPEELLEYAESSLDKIDYGSARGVFVLDRENGYALKIALPDNFSGGIHQNKSETQISEHLPKITANVIKHHPDYYWIIVELANPLDNQKELLKALNLSSPGDLGLLYGKFPPKNHKLLKEPNPIAILVSKLVEKGILPRDVQKSDSWGYTKDKRLVLIDYGKIN